MSKKIIRLVGGALTMACLLQCSSGGDLDSRTNSAGGSSGSSGSSGSGNASAGGSSGSAGAAGASGGSGSGGSINSAGSGGSDMECAREEYGGKLIPLDLLVLIDRSASMKIDGKWTSVTNALKTFVDSPDAAGISMGMQAFPMPPSMPIPQTCMTPADCGEYGPCIPVVGNFICAGSIANDSCIPQDYNSAPVPIQLLPGHAGFIKQTLDNTQPEGSSTPTEPAIKGVIAYATQWAQNNPSHVTAVVLATDGEPLGCSTNSVNGAASVASMAAGGSPPVKTFVIGVGGELGSLNAIAQSGGTDKAYLVSAGSGTTQAFLDALNEIRGEVACQYQIPKPKEGTVDFKKVNVEFLAPGKEPEPILQVPSASDCGTDGGWYYDNPNMPSQILLCPVSCAQVKSQQDIQVSVVLGCETKVRPPK